MQDLPPSKTPETNPPRFGRLRLRAKLILSNLLIAFAAVMAMGYYVYYRTQQTAAVLSNQLENNVEMQAQTHLTATVAEGADSQNAFFVTTRNNILELRTNVEKLLSQEAALGNGNYWNARQSLIQLSNGAWDNSNSEPGSVFIPARPAISDSLITSLNATKLLDFSAPVILQQNPDVIAVYYGGATGETLYYPNVDLANLVPPDFDVTSRPWFVKATPAQDPDANVVWSDPYVDAAHNGLVITGSAPVYDSAGNFRGVAAIDIQLNAVTNLVAQIQIEQTGYAFLIDSGGRLIAMPDSGYYKLNVTPTTAPLGEVLDPALLAGISPDFNGIISAMEKGESGIRTISINGTQQYVVYHSVPEVNYSLAIIVPVKEMLSESVAAEEQFAQNTRATQFFSLALVAAILIATVLASWGIGNALTSPLEQLTRTAQDIANGNLNTEARVTTQDETGTLANTLNTMTSRLRELVGSLEQRVSDRTREIERQAFRLRAAAEVARDAASAPNLDELLDRSSRLIHDRFGFYHTGIFLLDEKKEYAVLRASPTEAGRKMLANNHRLRIGEQGMVGTVAASGVPRIALDTGADSVYFDNPLLPDTRSEMALPLKTNEGIIGVLDVQSEQPNAFTQDDIAIIQVMADQLATAIERSRLLQQVESQLHEIEQTYGRFTQEAWRTFAQGDSKVAGYHYDSFQLRSIQEPVNIPEDAQTGASRSTLIPIQLRGETIGGISVRFQGEQPPEATLAIIQQTAERLATALETSRLLEETQKNAARDQLVSHVSSRIRETLDMESVLRTAALELQKAFGLKEAEVYLSPSSMETSSRTTKPRKKATGSNVHDGES